MEMTQDDIANSLRNICDVQQKIASTGNSTIFIGKHLLSERRVAVKCFKDKREAIKERDTLQLLRRKLPEGTQIPDVVGFIESEGILLIGWIDGESFAEYLSSKRCTFDSTRLRVEAVAKWLYEFHFVDPPSVGVIRFEKKLAQIFAIVNDRSSSRIGSWAIRYCGKSLTRKAEGLSGTQIAEGSLHGDFKPENIMLKGCSVTGMDFGQVFFGPVSNDLAYFLVELRFSLLQRIPLKSLFWYRGLAAKFINSYSADGMFISNRILAWTQQEVLLRKLHSSIRKKQSVFRCWIEILIILSVFCVVGVGYARSDNQENSS